MSQNISHCAEEPICVFQPIWLVNLFPPHDGKNLQRQSKYPVNDGIHYEGIDFPAAGPTPVKQINKSEAQNRNLAINVFGWGK